MSLFHPVNEPRMAELERRVQALENELAELQTKISKPAPKKRGRPPKQPRDFPVDVQSP